jgi:hypothetical protein
VTHRALAARWSRSRLESVKAVGILRRAVLTRFIVDTTGLVEPSSIAFTSTEDPRFAAAARSG